LELRKFRPRCPECGSILKKSKKGYLCPNSKCDVITVRFDRSLRVESIVREGFDNLGVFGKRQKKEGS